MTQAQQRQRLLHQIERLARTAVFGTLSESYRTCGQPGCRCQGSGPKHGPHLYVSYRGEDGKTTGYYVPQAAQKGIRAGTTAWKRLQEQLRRLAKINKKEILERARDREGRSR